MNRLANYKAKRDLDRTPEPGGGSRRLKADKRVFVIQRHKASRLHYDLRLELEGVLKSWAIPKGPSLDPAHKRLAMMVEDHPYDYKDFSGVIPEGNYGAGIVEIWDKGTFEPVDENSRVITEKEALNALAGGSLKFRLKGRKLKGEFALVHMKTGDQDNAWLLIKHRDDAAVTGYDSEEHVAKNSPINKFLAEKAAKRSSKSRSLIKTGRK